MRLTIRLLSLFLGAALVAAAPPAEGRISRIEITRTEPAFGGQSFGAVGAYQRLAGRAYGEVDPAHPGNAIIQDLYLAPRNARGLVRMIRTFIHLGFNRDERGRRVFDGAYPHIGGGLMPLNVRFAQPGRAWGEQIDHLYPAYDFPFAYTRQHDPLSQRTQGVLLNAGDSWLAPGGGRRYASGKPSRRRAPW